MKLPCEFKDCTNSRRVQGLCSGHYMQKRKGKTLQPIRNQDPRSTPQCAEDGCEGTPYGGITCKKHWEANRVARGLPKQPWDVL